MLYVERDQEGKLVAIRHSPDKESSEQKSMMDEEILEFLNKNIDTDPLVQLLSMSDVHIIRILEDLIDLLIRKNLILFTDLPEQAQEKIRERKRVRMKMDDSNIMVDDII